MIGAPSPGLAAAEQRWMVDAAQWRSTPTDDGSGGQSVAWAQIDTVQVLLSLPSPAERVAADQEGVDFTHTIKTPTGVDLRRGDRLVVDGRTVKVTSVATGTLSTMQHARGSEQPWDEPI